MANAKTNTKSNNNDSKRIEELEKTVSDLNNMIALLMKQSATNSAVSIGDRDITFISLCNHILNLSTEPNGGGTIYTFTEFGEEQSIPYSDAKRIIKSNKSFIQGGKCYIADDELIKSEHLVNDYKKILSKDSLLELLSAERTKFPSIFDAMTDTQKELFRDIVVDKLSKNKNSVDMNIVQYINESLNIDILSSINFSKELLKNED